MQCKPAPGHRFVTQFTAYRSKREEEEEEKPLSERVVLFLIEQLAEEGDPISERALPSGHRKGGHMHLGQQHMKGRPVQLVGTTGMAALVNGKSMWVMRKGGTCTWGSSNDEDGQRQTWPAATGQRNTWTEKKKREALGMISGLAKSLDCPENHGS